MDPGDHISWMDPLLSGHGTGKRKYVVIFLFYGISELKREQTTISSSYRWEWKTHTMPCQVIFLFF